MEGLIFGILQYSFQAVLDKNNLACSSKICGPCALHLGHKLGRKSLICNLQY